MKFYRGIRTPEGCVVTVEEGGRSRPLDMRTDVRNHSPGGPNWGYAGSGPAQLSLAILCDALGDVERARGLYQQYKARIIAAITTDAWTLAHDNVMKSVVHLEAEGRPS